MPGVDTIRTALEAAREYLSDERDGCLATGTYPDGRLDPDEQEHVDKLESLLAQIDAALAQPQPSNDFRDAYQGAREDMLIWKRRALEAEESARQLTRALCKEVNGPMHMGEPAQPQPAGMVTVEYHQRAVAEARRQALEDAEEACVITRGKNHASAASYKSSVKSYVQACDDCEDAIRALQDQAPQPAEPTEAQIEEYEILCNGEWVGGASGKGAKAAIAHYLMQYEQDGECEVYAVTRRLVDRAAFAAKEA